MLNLFPLSIKVFLYILFKMLLKKQFTYLKKAKKLTKFKKIKIKNKSLVKNIFFLFKNEFIEVSWIFKNNILYYKDYN